MCVCVCVCTSIQPVCRLIDHTQLLQKNISYVVMLCDMYQLHHTQPVAMNSSCSPSPLFLYLFTCISSIDSPPTTPLLPHHTITFIPPSFPPPSHSSPSTIPHSQPTISHSSSPTIPLHHHTPFSSTIPHSHYLSPYKPLHILPVILLTCHSTLLHIPPLPSCLTSSPPPQHFLPNSSPHSRHATPPHLPVSQFYLLFPHFL